jgi:hypothetical protein
MGTHNSGHGNLIVHFGNVSLMWKFVEYACDFGNRLNIIWSKRNNLWKEIFFSLLGALHSLSFVECNAPNKIKRDVAVHLSRIHCLDFSKRNLVQCLTRSRNLFSALPHNWSLTARFLSTSQLSCYCCCYSIDDRLVDTAALSHFSAQLKCFYHMLLKFYSVSTELGLSPFLPKYTNAWTEIVWNVVFYF